MNLKEDLDTDVRVDFFIPVERVIAFSTILG